MSLPFPSDSEIIDVVNAVQKETGCGTDAIAGDETMSARVRTLLPEDYALVSCVKLMARAQQLRKSGRIDKVGGGKGQRSEADLEHTGCEQLGGSRLEAANEYRWTKTDIFQKEVRPLVLARDKNRCQFCYGTERLNVHHRSYKQCRTSAEIEDCITLCRTCHGGLHDVWDKRRTGKPSPLQNECNSLRRSSDDH